MQKRICIKERASDSGEREERGEVGGGVKNDEGVRGADTEGRKVQKHMC